jgi:PilZ domain
MERRMSSRAQVDVPICALVDGFRHPCRAFDLSPTGMVFERSRALAGRHVTQVSPFEIYLPNSRLIRARARPVWAKDRLMAVKFVMINDADRLTLAELLDRKVRLREPLH